MERKGLLAAALLLCLASLTGCSGASDSSSAENADIVWEEFGSYQVGVQTLDGSQRQILLQQNGAKIVVDAISDVSVSGVRIRPFGEDFLLTLEYPYMGGWCQNWYYHLTEDGAVRIAESAGDPDGYGLRDLDGDGVDELICNIVYAGDGGRGARVYRMEGGAVQVAGVNQAEIPDGKALMGFVYTEYDFSTDLVHSFYNLCDSETLHEEMPSGEEMHDETAPLDASRLEFYDYIPSGT